MNVFREPIAKGEIASEADLKRAFRTLALRLHPDTCLEGASAARFVEFMVSGGARGTRQAPGR